MRTHHEISRWLCRVLLVLLVNASALAAGISVSVGDVFVANYGGSSVLKINPVTGAQQSVGTYVYPPTDVALSSGGDLYVCEWGGSIWRIHLYDGTQTLINPGSTLSQVWGIAIGPSGDLFVTTGLGNKVVRVNPTTGAETLLTQADQLNLVVGVEVLDASHLVVASYNNNALVSVALADGTQSVVAQAVGGLGIHSPWGIALYGANLYSAGYDSKTVQRTTVPGYVVTDLANTPGYPRGIGVGPDGDVWVGSFGAAAELVRMSPAGSTLRSYSGGAIREITGVEVSRISVVPPPPPNVAPVLAAIADRSVTAGNLLSLTATATDADVPAQTLTFSLEPGFPTGASITSGGLFSWTPTAGQAPSSNLITVKVTDSGSPALSSTTSFTVVVQQANVPPVLTAIGNKTINEGGLLGFTATATDANLPAQPLTFSLDAGAPTGASITSGGVFTWTPTEAQGPSINPITVRVSDGVASTAETISVVVNEVNAAPVLAAIGNRTVNESNLLSFTATATDADVPAQTLTYSLDAGAPTGASITSGGAFTWMPTEAQGPSINTITVRVSDGMATAFETITVVVNEVNIAPVLAPIGNRTVNEGSLLSFTATATDADVPAQPLTFSLDAGAPTGASITSGGAFTWTPTGTQAPSINTITVRVNDGTATAFETISVVVSEVNSAPVLAPIGNRTVNEGSLLSFTATATDADVPAQTLTFSLDAGAPTGASITSGGAFTWTPTEAQGPSINNITVRVSDGAATAFETITVVVSEVNTAPVLAAIGNRTINEDNLLSFTATATDTDMPAQPLTFSLDAGAPTGAGITSGGAFTWTPTEAQGPSINTITVRVSDGAATAFETITVVVSEVNTAPVLAAIGNRTINEDNLLSFTATATDTDMPAQPLTFSLDAGAPTGASITSGGAFTWTPTEAQGPSINTITVRVSDGTATAFETITVVVSEVNAAPVLAAIGNQTVSEGSLLTFTAMATDSDAPAQPLTFSLDAGAPTGAGITSGGAFTWTPTEAQGPSINTITVRVSDGAATAFETITVVVSEVNAAPVLAAIGNQTVSEGSLLTFTAMATDSDAPAQPLTFSLDAGAPTGASITSGGAFTWTPTEAQGPSTNAITVRVSDGTATGFETITVVVSEVNAAPVLAAIGNQMVNEGSLLNFTATAIDGDMPAQTLTFSLDAGAPTGASIASGGAFTWTPTEAQGPSTNAITVRISDGTATAFETITVVVSEVNAAPVLAAVGNQMVNEGSLLNFTATAIDGDMPAQTLTFSLDAGAPTGASIASGGAFTWTPTEAQGPSTNAITVRISDGTATAFETITVVVSEVNAAPVLAAIGNQTVSEGSLLTFTAMATDSDAPAQSLTFSLDAGAPTGASITSGGAFTWTPTEGQGPSTNAITVRVGDGTATAFETITVVVNEVNAAPVLAAIGNQTVSEGSLLSFTATAGDADVPAQPLTFSLDAGAPVGASITSGGAFTWTPTEGQGPGTNAITVRVGDGTATAFETITVVVNEVNAAPVLAAIGNQTVNENSPLSFTATATDADVPAQPLTFSLDAGAPTGASITSGGAFTWTPTEGQGPSTNAITVRVGDGTATAFETITVVVNELNAAPVLAAIGNQTVNESNLLSFTATATDADVPAQPLTFSLDAGAPVGASITSGGAFTWTPTEGQGPSTNAITVRVGDGTATAFETITVVVNELNAAPVLAAIGNQTVNESNLLSFTATATDADVPAQPLTFSLDAGAPVGASITSGGAFTWTPTEGQGPSTNAITVRVSDGTASAFETITVVVNEVNAAPVLAAIGNQTVNENSPLSFTATATDADVPAQPLTFSLDAGAPTGASITSGGAFTWTPTEGQGPSTNAITVRVGDGTATAFETITVVVNELNAAPVLAAIGNQTVNESNLLSFTATATDADVPAQPLTFSLDAGAPTGASITSGGAFTWTPTELEGPSTNAITVRVSDGTATAFETITVVVNELNAAPVLAAIGNQTVNESNLLSFTATATDADVPAQTLTFSLDAGAPTGASITSGGAFTWTPTELEGPSTNAITVRVSDGTATAFETITVVVNELNAAPVLAAIGNQTVNESNLLSFTATATDADVPAQTLTFSLDAGAPTGASITSGGAFTWTPTELEGPSTNAITVRVSDGTATAFETITVVVNELNAAPVLAAIGNQTVNESNLLSFTAMATDADVPAQTLTFSLDAGAPTGASITSGGAFTWTPTELEGPSTNAITVRVSDGTATAFETITVVVNELNAAPVLAAIGNQTVNESNLLSFTATATDADVPAQTLTFSLDAGAPTGASITSSGAFTWTPTGAQGPSTNAITVRVSDGVATASETITVVVTESSAAPHITGLTLVPAGGIILQWEAIPGMTYQVQSQDRLGETNWVNVGAPIVATSVAASIHDSRAVGLQRYYRIILNPYLAPYITGLTLAPGGGVNLQWEAIPGMTYQVQSQDRLGDANWDNVGSPVLASTVVASIRDARVAGLQRYYRIMLVP